MNNNNNKNSFFGQETNFEVYNKNNNVINNNYNYNDNIDKNEKTDNKPNFARNLRGRLGFWSETPEEMMNKEMAKQEYKNYIESQIADKKKKQEMEKNMQIQLELKEESKIRQQLDEINHFSADSKIFDQSTFFWKILIIINYF